MLDDPGVMRPGPVDHDSSLQWDNVARRYVAIIASTTRLAIQSGRPEAATSGLFGLSSMTEMVDRLKNLGPKQKSQVIRSCIFQAHTLLIESASVPDADLFLATHFVGGSIGLGNWLDEEALWAKFAILWSCKALLDLAERKRLNPYSLNDLGTLARMCIEKIDNGARYGETVVLACDVFQRLSGFFTAPASSSEAQVLREIRTQLDSLERWFEAKEKHHAVAQAALVTALAVVRAIVVPEPYDRAEQLEWPETPAAAPRPSPPTNLNPDNNFRDESKKSD